MARELTILGAGAAGLSLGYFARKSGIPFTIFESEARIGGNCITIKNGDFCFDSGAHRFHAVDPFITAEIQKLMPNGLREISCPSVIYHQKRTVDFPLSPLNLFRFLGVRQSLRVGWEQLRTQNGNGDEFSSFREMAIRRYGPTIAELFLLNYSKKLWGEQTDNLLPDISGKRMKGLNLRTFLTEAFMGRTGKTRHLDGRFLYPVSGGFGQILGALADYCGSESIRLNSRVTRVFHSDGRISDIEINHKERISVDMVASTLPINHLIRKLEPKVGNETEQSADRIAFRSIRLVALFINRPSIGHYATVYFPGSDFVFTRVYEPRNRNPRMAPPNRTSLVAEIPCSPGDVVWNMSDEELLEEVTASLVSLGWLQHNDVTGFDFYKIETAYPLLTIHGQDDLILLREYLDSFENLILNGRPGTFAYLHFHDVMRAACEMINSLKISPGNQMKWNQNDYR